MDPFISKPTVIDAVYFANAEDVEGLKGLDVRYEDLPYGKPNVSPKGSIYVSFLTKQGVRTTARPGEWIARENGTDDKYYPIDNETFLARWKPLDKGGKHS